MVKLVNRARMTTPGTGIGTLTLGVALDGFQSFAAAGVGNGDVLRYLIEEGEVRNPTHPVSDSDNIRSRAAIIRSPRDVAAELGSVMSPWTGSVKRLGPGAAGAVRGAARAL